jgi:hypothetical protein
MVLWCHPDKWVVSASANLTHKLEREFCSSNPEKIRTRCTASGLSIKILHPHHSTESTFSQLIANLKSQKSQYFWWACQITVIFALQFLIYSDNTIFFMILFVLHLYYIKKKFWPSTSTSKIEISSGFFGPRASYRLSGSALDSRLDPRGQSSTSTSILAPRVFSPIEHHYKMPVGHDSRQHSWSPCMVLIFTACHCT